MLKITIDRIMKTATMIHYFIQLNVAKKFQTHGILHVGGLMYESAQTPADYCVWTG